MFPGIAQTIFAKVHASDVVEASEPAWARSLFVKEASWAHHASVMQRIKIVAALDIEDRVPRIAAPVLLVRGADDSFTGHTTARLRALLPTVDVVALPGGHLPHVTSSGLFARAVRDFLAVFHFYDMSNANDSPLYTTEGMEVVITKDNPEIRAKVLELQENPFYKTTDVDIALTSTGYVSWRAVEELKK